MSQATRPVLYVGGGVQLAKATDAVREFLRLNPMPAVSTLKGLGTIERDDPHYLGMLGMHGTKAANLVVQESDLLIVVGARFDDRVTGSLIPLHHTQRLSISISMPLSSVNCVLLMRQFVVTSTRSCLTRAKPRYLILGSPL